MRRAMDLIHYVVKDGVLNSSESGLHSQREELENDRGTAYACMRHLQRLLEHSKATMGELLVSYLEPFYIYNIILGAALHCLMA